MKIWSGLCIGFLVVGILGCVSSKKAIKEPALAVNEVLKRIQQRNEKIKSLKGSGTITIESPEASNTGSFDMDLKKPDSLKVELSGPFGIRLGTVFLSREKFLFYNWMNNTAVIGKPNGKTINSVLKLRMQFDEIINAFSGGFPTVKEQDSLEKFSVDQDSYMLQYRSDKGKTEYWVDRDAFVVTGYRIVDSAGDPVLTAIASRLEQAEEIVAPRFLRLIFPQEHTSVTIAYDDIFINKPVTCFFALPSTAEVIYR